MIDLLMKDAQRIKEFCIQMQEDIERNKWANVVDSAKAIELIARRCFNAGSAEVQKEWEAMK